MGIALEAVALKVAVVSPEATVTDVGIVRRELLVASVTLVVLEVFLLSLTVQVLLSLCLRLAGTQKTFETCNGACSAIVALCELDPAVAVTVAF